MGYFEDNYQAPCVACDHCGYTDSMTAFPRTAADIKSKQEQRGERIDYNEVGLPPEPELCGGF